MLVAHSGEVVPWWHGGMVRVAPYGVKLSHVKKKAGISTSFKRFCPSYRDLLV